MNEWRQRQLVEQYLKQLDLLHDAHFGGPHHSKEERKILQRVRTASRQDHAKSILEFVARQPDPEGELKRQIEKMRETVYHARKQAIWAVKHLPHPSHGGRKPKLLPQKISKVMQQVSHLLSEGVAKGSAYQIVAGAFRVHPRTVARIWKRGEK